MKFEYSIDIPVDRKIVWRVAQDQAQRPKWDVRVSKYIIHGTAEVGTPVSITVKTFPVRAVAQGEFLRFDSEEQSILRIKSIKPEIIPTGGGTWLFEKTSEGTRFTTRFSLKDDEAIFFPRWLLKILVRWDTIRSLKKLKALVLSYQNKIIMDEQK